MNEYAQKSFSAIISGFDTMVIKIEGEWEQIGEDASILDADEYYLCARFKNGGLIPLPIIMNWQGAVSPEQAEAIARAGEINPASLEQAKTACRNVKQFFISNYTKT